MNGQNINQMKLTPEVIIDTICRAMEINVDDVVLNKTRKAEVVMCRHICFYFIQQYVKSKAYPDKPIEYVAIARIFNKNHATIIHAIRKVNDYMKFNLKFRERIYIYTQIIERQMDETLCNCCGSKLTFENANNKSLH